jgi:fucose permease
MQKPDPESTPTASTTGQKTAQSAHLPDSQILPSRETAPRANATIPLSFGAFILIGANDGALGVLLPSIRAHYQVNNATIGMFFLCSTVGYLIASFNNGPLIEKLGNRLFLMVGTAIFLLGVSILSLMPPFVVLLGAGLLLGMGGAMLDAGLNSYIAALPRSTAMLNYLHAFYGAGAWLGPVVASSLLALQWGWNSVYLVWGGLSIVLLLGLGIFFGNGSRQEKLPAAGNVLATALRLRVVWLGALFLLFYVGSEVSLGSWSYSFLTEERHGALLLTGWVVSGYWLGLTVGRLALARVAQRIGAQRLIELCLVGVVVGLLLVWLVPVEIVAASALWLIGFSLGPIFPTTIALMSRLVSARILPSAIGFLASLGSMGGALFPWLAGNLAQRVGLWSLLPFVIVLTIFMLGLWLALQRQPAVTT